MKQRHKKISMTKVSTYLFFIATPMGAHGKDGFVSFPVSPLFSALPLGFCVLIH